MAKELTLVELQKQIEELQVKANVIIQAEKAGVIEEIKAKISMYKLTFEELGFKALEPVIVYKKASASAQGQGQAPKIPVYRNVLNNAETWHGGKGAYPLWVHSVIDANLEDKKAKNPAGNMTVPKDVLIKYLDENGYKIPVPVVSPEVATEAKAVEPAKADKK